MRYCSQLAFSHVVNCLLDKNEISQLVHSMTQLDVVQLACSQYDTSMFTV